MAIGAVLGGADAAGRVRKMRIERLAAVAFSGDGLLLRVNPFAIRVLRANDDGARRTNHREPIALHRSVDAELEDVVTDDLGIIRREVARGDPFILVERRALIRLHGQMTAEATGGPRGMADLAGDG